jgi:hypothetical protein
MIKKKYTLSNFKQLDLATLNYLPWPHSITECKVGIMIQKFSTTKGLGSGGIEVGFLKV